MAHHCDSIIPILNRKRGGGGGAAPFIMTVETTGVDETFTIINDTVYGSQVFNATIDWGDGQTSAITAVDDADLAHTYATPGVHTIRISGTYPNIYFRNNLDASKVRSVQQLGDVGWSSLYRAFNNCSGLTSFTPGPCDTSGVSHGLAFFGMLNNCDALTSLDMRAVDVSGAVGASAGRQVFAGSALLESVDVTGWDVSAVSSFVNMFFECPSLTSIAGLDGWDYTGVTSTLGLNSFITQGRMTTAQYDALLISLNSQAASMPTGMTPNFGASTYTLGGAAEAARTNLINTYSWVITDGGGV